MVTGSIFGDFWGSESMDYEGLYIYSGGTGCGGVGSGTPLLWLSDVGIGELPIGIGVEGKGLNGVERELTESGRIMDMNYGTKGRVWELG